MATYDAKTESTRLIVQAMLGIYSEKQKTIGNSYGPKLLNHKAVKSNQLNHYQIITTTFVQKSFDKISKLASLIYFQNKDSRQVTIKSEEETEVGYLQPNDKITANIIDILTEKESNVVSS